MPEEKLGRQFRFRAWDTDEKRMVSPDYIDRNGVAWWKENSIPTSSKIVMQFTGLKDKKGKEIYEGDVVSWLAWYGDEKRILNRIVYFEGGAFYPVCDAPPSEFEVIGNIYEDAGSLKEAETK